MTVTYNPRSQCAGKVRYRTKDIAKARRADEEQRIGLRLRVYRCPHCDLFHLGNAVHQTITPDELKTTITDEMRFAARRARILHQARAERQHRTAS